jgi:hypothetical protein
LPVGTRLLKASHKIGIIIFKKLPNIEILRIYRIFIIDFLISRKFLIKFEKKLRNDEIPTDLGKFLSIFTRFIYSL